MSDDHRGPDRGRLVGRVVAVLVLAGLARGAAGDASLTTADVVRFLRAGISESTILMEIQNRGFGEPLDAAREAALREAGATETLVVAVRRAAPAGGPPAPAASAPPGPSAGGPSPATPAAAGGRPVFDVGARTVRVPVAVVDKSGEPVLGLRAEDFRISDEGKRQPVTQFSGERRALRIALALDVSGSMQNKIREVEAALRHFIDLLEPADEIMVITFNDHVQVLQDFTSDREMLARVLDMLEPAGGTALYDAAAEAIRRVAPGSAESKAVVLVTDGVDTASDTSFDALRELARRSEVPVFSIGLDSGTDLRDFFRRPGGGGPLGGFPGMGGGRRGPGGGGGRGGWGRGGGSGRGARKEGFDAAPLKNLAEETGGLAEIVKDLGHYTPGGDERSGDHLKAAVESIAMTLRHRYLLGYDTPDGKKGWRTIRVEVDRPAANARARKGYYAGG